MKAAENFTFLGMFVSGLGLGMQIMDLSHPWLLLAGVGFVFAVVSATFPKLD